MSRSMALAAVVACGLVSLDAEDVEVPRANDPGSTVALVAREPELVTPVGVEVDDRGQVLVIESQTHFRPEGYQGPERDRIRLFADDDGDGRFERIETLFEGTTHTMGLALEADGSLVVATRSELFRLRRDAEGKVVGREPLARLETEEAYPHNGLSGVAVDVDGTLYVGMGENMGKLFALVGHDGRRHEGAGEGGSVFRLAPDGSGLERVATGFWNPFHMAFDAYGRLFVVDNDPDSRPPCRLIHVVEGGDYGFRFRHGRRGVNPFTSWNGEVPGTLPMAGGTGEAPSGIALLGHRLGLPAFAVTSWGDHRVERHRMVPRGASFASQRDDLVTGGVMFRPVGASVAPDGSLFVSDWVSRSYPIHGLGRLWRLVPEDAWRRSMAEARRTAVEARVLARTEAGRVELRRRALDRDRPSVERAAAIRGLDPAGLSEVLTELVREQAGPLVAVALRRGGRAGSGEEMIRLARGALGDEAAAEALRRLEGDPASPVLREALGSPDPFIRQAARRAAERVVGAGTLVAWLDSPETPAIARAEILVALRELDPSAHDDQIRSALQDPDERVRLVALKWAHETGRSGLRDAIDQTVTIAPIDERLFAAYLLARRAEGPDARSPEEDRPPVADLLRLAEDGALPSTVRRLAVRLLPTDLGEAGREVLSRLLEDRDASVRLEAVRVASGVETDALSDRLRAIATDPRRPEAERAEAAAGLARGASGNERTLVRLAGDPAKAVARQAVRGLRGLVLDAAQHDAIERDGLGRLLDPAGQGWPVEEAETIAAAAGDPAEGQRIFFHPKGPGCYRCHRVEGRGGRVGPDLTGFGRESGRARLVRSLLRPSEEVSPQYTAWRLAMKDGRVATGQMLGERGDVLLMADETGRPFEVKKDDIEEQTALDVSIMPQDLARQMTREEFRDLIAYLMNPTDAPRGGGPGGGP